MIEFHTRLELLVISLQDRTVPASCPALGRLVIYLLPKLWFLTSDMRSSEGVTEDIDRRKETRMRKAKYIIYMDNTSIWKHYFD